MPKFDKVPLSFDVTLYGTLEPFDDSKSKCRVRIFYKGMNRNRTYITEDFANQLIASLPYAPVKGIFNSDEVDLKDMEKRTVKAKFTAQLWLSQILLGKSIQTQMALQELMLALM